MAKQTKTKGPTLCASVIEVKVQRLIENHFHRMRQDPPENQRVWEIVVANNAYHLACTKNDPQYYKIHILALATEWNFELKDFNDVKLISREFDTVEELDEIIAETQLIIRVDRIRRDNN